MTRSHPFRWLLVLLLPALPSCGYPCEPEPLVVEDPAPKASTAEGATGEAAQVRSGETPLPPTGPAAPDGRSRAALPPGEATKPLAGGFEGHGAPEQEPGMPMPSPARAPVEDLEVGDKVNERSAIERLLAAETQKRRTLHFFVETSCGDAVCQHLAAFCESSYRDFKTWCGLSPATGLWDTRARVVVLLNQAEWDRLIAQRWGNPRQDQALRRFWGPDPPQMSLLSLQDVSSQGDRIALFHLLNHLFLHGLARSGSEGWLAWLWEGFAWHRSLEEFPDGRIESAGAAGPGRGEEDAAWRDPDDWVELLKRDVRARQDEDFILFWHKDALAIRWKTYVKAWSIVRYLTRDEGEKAKFVSFVSSLKTSKDQARALWGVYGWSPDDLDKAWREWIRNQPNRWRKK